MSAAVAEDYMEEGAGALDLRVTKIESDLAHVSSSVANIEIDLRDMRKSMDQRFEAANGEFKAVRAEMSVEFRAVRTKMSTEFKAVRAEMSAGFESVRAEMAAGRAEISAEFNAVREEMKADRAVMSAEFKAVREEMNTIAAAGCLECQFVTVALTWAESGLSVPAEFTAATAK
jgi:hypothetical protein